MTLRQEQQRFSPLLSGNNAPLKWARNLLSRVLITVLVVCGLAACGPGRIHHDFPLKDINLTKIGPVPIAGDWVGICFWTDDRSEIGYNYPIDFLPMIQRRDFMVNDPTFGFKIFFNASDYYQFVVLYQKDGSADAYLWTAKIPDAYIEGDDACISRERACFNVTDGRSGPLLTFGVCS